MTERDRRRAIQVKLARSQSRPAVFLTTGFSTLDQALGGGLPRGRIAELFGPSSSGKTTLALQIIAQAQEHGLSAAWIDVEGGFDPAYAVRQGVILERMPVARPDTAEESLEIGRQLTGSGGIDFLVMDSAAAMTPALELEIGLGDGGPGLQSRILASGFRRLGFAAARTETAILVLNQLRSRASGSEQETSAGGPGLKLHAAVRVALEESVGGAGMRFRVIKTRAGSAFREGDLRPVGVA